MSGERSGVLEDVTLVQYALVAAVALFAAVIGGVAGYGGGLLLPPILVPIIGPEAVVPVLSLAALLTNASRLLAFRSEFQFRRALFVSLCALPTCLLGAWGYTLLTGPWVAVLIGAMLIVLVPVRRVLTRLHGHLGVPGVAAASVGYGLLVGGTSGSGVILISILLAAGLEGRAVIATDCGISLVLGIVKSIVFQTAGALPPSSWVMALLIGTAATPGAFIARSLTRSLSVKAHGYLLDGVVVFGGTLLVVEGVRHLAR